MASGLEVRAPFCDHRVVEHVVEISTKTLPAGSREKAVLRAAAEDILPRGVLQRQKSPYPSVLDSACLRKNTRHVRLFNDSARKDIGRIFHPRVFERGHSANTADATRLISNMEEEMVLNFAAWFRHYQPRLCA